MARALQCPSCGSTMPLGHGEAGETIRCESCGQAMKVPPGLSRRETAVPPSAGAPVGAAAGASSGGAAHAIAPPAPRRPSRPTMTAGGAAAGAAGGTAVMAPSTPASTPQTPPGSVLSSGRTHRGARYAGGGRDALPLWLRILVWVIALPLGLVIVGVPARAAGYLTSQKLLDVIVKHDLDRFVPIVVIVALWALVTALLVTALVEGGRWWMLRHRAHKERDSLVVS